MLKAFFELLTNKQIQKFYLLQILFAITALIQVAGIVSLAPFITLISDPSLIETNEYINWAYTFGGFKGKNQFFMFFSLMIMIMVIIGNSAGALSTWGLLKYSVRIGADLQNRVFGNYLKNDYIFFAGSNSSSLISVLTQEIPRFVYMVLQPFLHLTSQLFVGIIIVAGLAYVDIFLAIISTTVIGGIYILIFKYLKLGLVRHGQTLSDVNVKRLKLLNEGISGVKQVKLIGSEFWYESEFKKINERGLNSSAYIGLSGDLPRYLVESVTFLAILGLALYLLQKYDSSAQIVSILSLYAMAGYKLLPAMQTIYKSYSQIKANGMVIVELKRELCRTDVEIENQESAEFDRLWESNEFSIDLNNIHFRYPGASGNALVGLSTKIMSGTMTAIVGGSGAGKSTLVDIILGLLFSQNGDLIIAGVKVNRNTCRSWQKCIGYVPQLIYIIDDTFTANIAFGIPARDVDMNRVIAAAKGACLYDYIITLPEGFDYKVGENGAQLSGGQIQRLGIARALYRDPQVLILDEATSALDNNTEFQIMNELVRLAQNKTIIMIAHRLSTVKYADNVIFLEDGRIIGEGTFDHLSATNEKFSELCRPGHT